MNIQEHVPLAPHTTFRIGGPARYFCLVHTETELHDAVAFAQAKKLRVFILGGGSNVLVSDAGFNGLVVKMEFRGIEIKGDRVSVAAGEMWDDVVEKTVSSGLFGLENLSAIPGTVGAAPVQNIGAYGADVSAFVENVHALDTTTMKFDDLTNAQCAFGYRDSVFKREKGRYVITRVDFKLMTEPHINIEYRDLKEYFERKGYDTVSAAKISPKDVRDAVTDIRWGKLPDWKLWGTAGSFFKNPIIPLQKFIELKQKYPDLPGFPEEDGRIKISLAWILDHVCGKRGLTQGNVGTYGKQALVIVAKPGATAEEVVRLSQEMINCVKENTGIEIMAEVEWVN